MGGTRRGTGGRLEDTRGAGTGGGRAGGHERGVRGTREAQGREIDLRPQRQGGFLRAALAEAEAQARAAVAQLHPARCAVCESGSGSNGVRVRACMFACVKRENVSAGVCECMYVHARIDERGRYWIYIYI